MFRFSTPRSPMTRLLLAGSSLVLLTCALAAQPQPPAKQPAAGEEEVQRVLEAMRKVAQRQQLLRGDALTEAQVRRAAQEAGTLPPERAVRTFLVSLGRAATRDDLGSPTMRGRADLTKHFFASAMLTELSGAREAEAIGIAKEQFDMAFGTGFSFSDLLANLAGIAFAEDLRQGKRTLAEIAESFRVNAHLPDPRPLKLDDGLRAKAFESRYGSTSDPRFVRELDRLRKAIQQQETPLDSPAPGR